MTTRRQDDARLEALELRAAHQDRVIDDLNAAVTGQWAMIEALQRRLAMLDSRLAEEADQRHEGGGPPG